LLFIQANRAFSIMFKSISQAIWRSHRRWLYGFMAGITAMSLIVATPQPSQAVSWWELLIRGAQILQLSNMSDQQEVGLGQQINQQLAVQLARQGTPLSNHRAATAYINQIGQRLVPNSSRPNIPYTFQVVEDPGINAFATMGGFVYINAGLMFEADNEAELASVVAHEIAHIADRHAVKQMRERAIQAGILSAAGLDESAAVQIGVQLALNLPNSREDEFAADRLGLNTLRKSGYAPQAMVSFMQKLQRGGAPPPFLSSHPAVGDRVQALSQSIQQNPPTANETAGLDNAAYSNILSSFAR
jgi:predicted Zn-dependent protease